MITDNRIITSWGLFNMSVKVTLNRANVLRRIKNGTDLSRAATTESLKKYSDPFTPRDKGPLIETAQVDTKEGEITYIQPYAKRLWHGVDFNFSKDKNLLATFKWNDQAANVHAKELQKIAQSNFTKGMK